MDQVANTENIGDVIKELIDREDWPVLKAALVDLHPADIAEIITRFDREERKRVFDLLHTDQAAEVAAELPTSILKEVAGDLEQKKLVEIVQTMDSDDAADVIGDLDDEIAEKILSAMPWEETREVRTLLRHNEESAGGIMAMEVVTVYDDQTASQALEALRKKSREVDDVYNIYVVDSNGILKGVVALKDLVLADPADKISDIMDPEFFSIHPEMDQEEVANYFHKYDLVAAPVTDEQGRLVGRITVDDVLDVVEEEASEDMALMAGITDENIGEGSVFKLSMGRLPWLMVAFFGEMISATVMRHFTVSIKEVVMSAFFIPLIMAMGGNTGIQSATVVIRGLAIGDFCIKDTGRKLVKELAVAMINGIIIAVLLVLISYIWIHNIRFGIILGTAMLAVLFNAALIGTVLPFFLKSIKIDPAVSTGPFITTSNDVLGLLVYFSLITFFAKWL